MKLKTQDMILQISELIKQKNALEEQINDYKLINNFLMKRENKLQQIEAMFKKGIVDLQELAMVVKEV